MSHEHALPLQEAVHQFKANDKVVLGSLVTEQWGTVYLIVGMSREKQAHISAGGEGFLQNPGPGIPPIRRNSRYRLYQVPCLASSTLKAVWITTSILEDGTEASIRCGDKASPVLGFQNCVE